MDQWSLGRLNVAEPISTECFLFSAESIPKALAQ